MKSKLLEQIKKSMFVQSFKAIDSRFIYSVLLDIAWVLLLVGILAASSSALKTNIMDITSLAPELEKLMEQMSFEEEEISAQIANIQVEMRTALTKLILTVIIAIISMIAVSALLKSLVWNKIKLNKFNKLYIKRLFLLNLWWIPVWLIVMTLITMLFKLEASKWIIGIIALAFFHLTTILSALFDEKKAVSQTIKNAFAIGIKKLHVFIVPYVLAAVILSFLATILYPLMLIQINLIVLISIFVIVFLFFEAWIRLYIPMIAKKI